MSKALYKDVHGCVYMNTYTYIGNYIHTRIYINICLTHQNTHKYIWTNEIPVSDT
jgi:hypothetical protein